jgi:hypothetical protein
MEYVKGWPVVKIVPFNMLVQSTVRKFKKHPFIKFHAPYALGPAPFPYIEYHLIYAYFNQKTSILQWIIQVFFAGMSPIASQFGVSRWYPSKVLRKNSSYSLASPSREEAPVFS